MKKYVATVYGRNNEVLDTIELDALFCFTENGAEAVDAEGERCMELHQPKAISDNGCGGRAYHANVPVPEIHQLIR